MSQTLIAKTTRGSRRTEHDGGEFFDLEPHARPNPRRLLAEAAARVAEEFGPEAWHEAQRLLDEMSAIDNDMSGLYATSAADARTMNGFLDLPDLPADGENWMSAYDPSDFE